MAWNEPEDNDRDKDKPRQEDPWGNRPGGGRDDQGPPDLDEIIGSLSRKLRGFLGGKGGGRSGGDQGGGKEPISTGLVIGIIIIIAIIWVGAGFYTVDEQERGVVLRFGEAQDSVVFPGLHWNPPLVDEVITINVTRVYDESFSNTMLTEDDNILDVSMSVQYQVNEARDYYLNVRNPVTSLQLAAESAIRAEIGSSEMQMAMTASRAEIAQSVQDRLQDYLDLYGTGIIISQVNIAEVQQPGPVRPAYDDVIEAQVDRESFQNEARAYANQIVPEARGQARRIIEEANAYREEVVADAEGQAQRFTQLLTEYEQAPEVTRERIYLDAIRDVLSNVTKVLVDVEGGNNMMYLPLDQLRQQRQTQGGAGNNPESLSNQQIRTLSNQVIQDIQSRSSTTNSGRTSSSTTRGSSAR